MRTAELLFPEPGQVPMTQVYVSHSLLHLGDIQALSCSLLWAGHGGYWGGLDKPSSQQDEWAVVGDFSVFTGHFGVLLLLAQGSVGF